MMQTSSSGLLKQKDLRSAGNSSTKNANSSSGLRARDGSTQKDRSAGRQTEATKLRSGPSSKQTSASKHFSPSPAKYQSNRVEGTLEAEIANNPNITNDPDELRRLLMIKIGKLGETIRRVQTQNFTIEDDVIERLRLMKGFNDQMERVNI